MTSPNQSINQLRKQHFLPPHWTEEEVMYYVEQVTLIEQECIEAENKITTPTERRDGEVNGQGEENDNTSIVVGIVALCAILFIIVVLTSR